MATPITVIDADETSDAFELVAAAGFKASTFTIVQHPTPTISPGIRGIGGSVVVTRRNGSSKSYVAGHDTHWLSELEIDLSAGVYGRPGSPHAANRW